MRQVRMMSPRTIGYFNIDKPKILGGNEVLLSIQRIGICGSDIHVFHGEHPAVTYPLVQGHEYSAIVEAIGENVKNISPGMKATARPQITCGICAPCLRGQYNVCKDLKVQGFQALGAAQDYFVVPEDRVVPFPDEISFEHGAMIEPLAVAVHAVKRPVSIKGKNVVVSGAGTIGNLVAQQAKAEGAGKVLVTDISDYRLDISKLCGIDGALNVNDKNFYDELNEFFGDEGFQIGFEAAGVESSLEFLVENVEKGGDVVIIGVYSQNPVVNMYYLGEHELNLIGSMMYRHEDYLDAVRAISNHKINLDPLISTSFSFEKFGDAYEFIEKNKEKSLKVIIEM